MMLFIVSWLVVAIVLCLIIARAIAGVSDGDCE